MAEKARIGKGNLDEHKENLIQIYKSLLKAHGLQKWWPTTPKGEFTPQYLGGPRNEKEQLEIIFGALLTQNTQWNPNVVRSIENLNRNNLIDLEEIQKIPKKKLAELIKSSGYNNQKAERLKILAQSISKFGGVKKLLSQQTPKLRETLLSIKGIGPETADSIILYAAKKPVFVVDAYTKRIFSRLGYFKEDAKYDKIQEFFMANLDHDAELFNEFHALIVEHAKVCCKKKSSSETCVLHAN